MQFDYMKRTVVDASLDVPDIGNCVIIANTDDGEFYVLVIRSILGWTEIFEFGPITPDIKELPRYTGQVYSRDEFSEFRIKKTIAKFLNGYPITQARVSDIDEAKKLVVSLRDYL